jgi:hypothetical protein
MFYSKLETVYDGTPGSDVKMLMGHFNAKIGKEDIFIPVKGKAVPLHAVEALGGR